MKKIILLDIDGVLLSLGKVPEDAVQIGAFTIKNSLKNWLQLLGRKTDIYWCSSWQEKSDIFAQLLNFETKGFLDFSGKRTKNYLWNKLEVLENFYLAHANAVFVLIDDNANPWLIKASQILNQAQECGKLLVIRPFAYTGLTDKEMEKINHWLSDVNS